MKKTISSQEKVTMSGVREVVKEIVDEAKTEIIKAIRSETARLKRDISHIQLEKSSTN